MSSRAEKGSVLGLMVSGTSEWDSTVISSFANCTEWFHLGTLNLAVVGVFSSVQFSSVTQSCPILCDPIDCSTWGLPVLHQLLELAQTHVHWVDDAIQPSHPLLSPSPPAFNLSQHQGLFKWLGRFFASGGQSTGVSSSACLYNIQSDIL